MADGRQVVLQMPRYLERETKTIPELLSSISVELICLSPSGPGCLDGFPSTGTAGYATPKAEHQRRKRIREVVPGGAEAWDSEGVPGVDSVLRGQLAHEITINFKTMPALFVKGLGAGACFVNLDQ